MKNLEKIIEVLEQETERFPDPLVDTVIQEFGHDPFLMLISCLLSLRAKDATTIHVCRDLFFRIKTAEQLCAMPRREVENIIYRTGFYKNKARIIQEVSCALFERYGGSVPRDYDQLMSLRGVGPKTANLIFGLAFEIPRICVDTHVHRISNRLGLIVTKTSGESEKELERVLPERQWIAWNKLLVKWGQNVCTPVSPKCNACPIRTWCKRRGVKKSR